MSNSTTTITAASVTGNLKAAKEEESGSGADAGGNAACAFCGASIPYGQSMCADCKKKYNVGSYDMGSDGCGCDK